MYHALLPSRETCIRTYRAQAARSDRGPYLLIKGILYTVNFEKPKVREVVILLVFIRLRTQHLLWNYESLLQRHRLTQIHPLSVTHMFVCVFKHELTHLGYP